ncbi:hypothetical protein B0H13DRAFT_2365514 [Mycena leptocephala]|nr:hypothetical protein B0H13DRAFT_2365514 [Mycena leptocephala]
MQISWLFDGPEDLLASRGDRRRWAEASIRELARCCALQPSPTAGSAQIWGTDGSMIPASATLCESRHVTAAATGPSTFYLTWGVNGPHLALVLRRDEGPIPLFYSDHQNSVDLIDDIRTQACHESRLRNMKEVLLSMDPRACS